jgi:hypothetical protein
MPLTMGWPNVKIAVAPARAGIELDRLKRSCSETFVRVAENVDQCQCQGFPFLLTVTL